MNTRTTWRTAAAVVTLAVGLLAMPGQAQANTSDVTQSRESVRETPLASLSAASRDRADHLEAQLEIDDLLSDQAINPVDYQCTTATPVRDWLASATANWTSADHAFVNILQQVVVLDAVLFPNDAGSSFGPNGAYTTQVSHAVRDLRSFWDIDGSGIRVVPMHSDMLLNEARVARIFQVAFGVDAKNAAQAAKDVRALADTDAFDHGRHPLLTFNAFAIDRLEVPGFGTIPPQILMGDGVLQGFDAVGLDDVAPQAIVAHEYGHHVQYQQNLFASPLAGAEASRRTELMADAFGAYYLTHARGASMQWKRVQEYSQVFFQLGDCAFSFGSHHGTPNQRLHAVQWGYDVAQNAENQGHILPSLNFAGRFEQELPILIAPDA